MSVREGQAVVLLCGPPPHYGGTVLCPNSSALSAVASLSCLPQQSLLFLTLLLIISLLRLFCFLYLPTSFCCSSFQTLTHRLSLTSPYLSDREFFYDESPLHLLMPLHLAFLASHFLTLSSLFSPI